MRDGVIADYQITEAMLRYFIKKATGGVRMFKPKVMISVPFGVTSVESRAVHEAAVAAGGATRDVHLIPEPIAAAIGAGMPVNTPTGNMVLDLGGGTTEAAVVSMNGIVVANSVRVGGVRMDEAIVAYIRKKYSLAIGEPTAEEIKFRLGAAIPLDEDLEMEIQGRDQVAGLPRTIRIRSSEDHRGAARTAVGHRRRGEERAGEDAARTRLGHHRSRHGAGGRRRAAPPDRSADHQGNGRGRLRGRSADGVRGDGRGQGAGELRDYSAEYWRVVSDE